MNSKIMTYVYFGAHFWVAALNQNLSEGQRRSEKHRPKERDRERVRSEKERERECEMCLH